MPTPLPSSFASAAAGNTQDPSRRGDASTGGEWYALKEKPCPPQSQAPSHPTENGSGVSVWLPRGHSISRKSKDPMLTLNHYIGRDPA